MRKFRNQLKGMSTKRLSILIIIGAMLAEMYMFVTCLANNEPFASLLCLGAILVNMVMIALKSAE